MSFSCSSMQPSMRQERRSSMVPRSHDRFVLPKCPSFRIGCVDGSLRPQDLTFVPVSDKLRKRKEATDLQLRTNQSGRTTLTSIRKEQKKDAHMWAHTSLLGFEMKQIIPTFALDLRWLAHASCPKAGNALRRKTIGKCRNGEQVCQVFLSNLHVFAWYTPQQI